MGIKQFLGIKWMDENPKILLYDNVTHSMQIWYISSFLI